MIFTNKGTRFPVSRRNESDPKAIKRLTAAREYLEELSPEEIEDKYGWHHQTIYNRLNRFEERGFEAALYDNKRPGGQLHAQKPLPPFSTSIR